MTLVVKAADTVRNLDTVTASKSSMITGTAGEALAALDVVYIDQSDGTIKLADATAANTLALAKGIVAAASALGDPCTVFGPGTRIKYADATLTPGSTLYVGATAGRLDDAATIGDADGFAFAVDTNDIIIAGYKL